MKTSTFTVRLLAICLSTFLNVKSQYTPDWPSLDSRPLPPWYDESKIGIFMHWGVYSVPSYGSEWFWYRWQGPEPRKDVLAFMHENYPSDWTYADFAQQFRAELYDPNEWADLFAASGAKYVVLTSKHHEGFTLWPSKYSFNWNAMDVGPKRDLVGDLANAVRNRTDLKFGLYHSLFEWFHPLYLQDKANNFTTHLFPTTKTMPELKEIVELYKPSIIWSDGDQGPDKYWNSTDFLAWLYNDSPVKDTVVTNDRWGSGLGCRHGGFYTCGDHFNPGHLLSHKWENCFIIGSAWSYVRKASLSHYLSIQEILYQVISTISCGGNALIDIGPTSYGKIMPIFQERLRQLGSWLNINGEAIYKSIPWKYQNDTVNGQVWYTSSKDNQTVYGHLLSWPSKTSEITLGAPKTSSSTVVTLLGYSGGPLQWRPAGTMGGIVIDVSNIKQASLTSDWAWVFKMTGVTPTESME